MTEPDHDSAGTTDRDLARAQAFGRLAAREGRECNPYDRHDRPNGEILWWRWLHAWIRAGGGEREIFGGRLRRAQWRMRELARRARYRREQAG